MLSGTTLCCIGTVAVGCYLFLYLAGKQQEVEHKDRTIRQWQRQQQEAEMARRQGVPTVVGGQQGQATGSPPSMPGGQPPQSAN